MELLDSRRLTGPNLISDGPGAVLDVGIPDVTAGGARKDEVLAVWSDHARALMHTVGWVAADAGVHVRRFEGGASLVLGAPIDGLYAACEINECAWQRTVAMFGGESRLSTSAEDVARLQALVAEERRPRLRGLARRAERQGVMFLTDDDAVSVGSGPGSITWPIDRLPDDNSVSWGDVTDVPVVLITGTNGKSTTTRMLAAIAKAAGRTPGFSSTDGLWIGGEQIDTGDYSGPGGARTVLRAKRTEIAILETARGGMLRRGLGVRRASAAALLNISRDHMGEYGVHVLDDLVEAKFIVRKAVAPDRPLVLNADDPLVVAAATRDERTSITWFSIAKDNAVVVAHLAAGGRACVVADGRLWFCVGQERTDVVGVSEMPASMLGAARFNISNAMAAVALAMAIDLPAAAMAKGLREFRSDSVSNPGRGNVFEFGDVTAIVDFAHNAHGMAALLEMANAMPAARRLVTIGMPGDRSDTEIREFVQATWAARPDRIVLKEMSVHLRGRPPGTVLDLMEAELARLGVPEDRVARTLSEVEATHHALQWARPGDLLLLSLQAERVEVLAMLADLSERGWCAGQSVPN
jgi:UDP-N-acetylmuramyl tripeptide synthase